MSVQDDKAAGHDDDQQATDKADDRPATEKPEPDEEDKKKAAEMMTAYEERPTVVLPGSGAMVTGTAVNDWLDEEGNPKFGDGEGSNEQAKGDDGGDGGDGGDGKSYSERVDEDKALNEQLREASKAENKGEKE